MSELNEKKKCLPEVESTCQTEQIVITVHSVEMKALVHAVPVDVPRNSEAPRKTRGGL